MVHGLRAVLVSVGEEPRRSPGAVALVRWLAAHVCGL